MLQVLVLELSILETQEGVLGGLGRGRRARLLPVLAARRERKRGQQSKQALIGRSEPPGAQPRQRNAYLSPTRPNLLEAVILLVQPSSAAVVDEHVQEHHRYLSLCLSVSSAPGAPRLRLVFGRARVPLILGLCPVFPPPK